MRNWRRLSLAALWILLKTPLVTGHEVKEACRDLEMIPQENGCGILQCQSGKLVPIVEACGKDFDGKCHQVGELFIIEPFTYRCNKLPSGIETVFKIEKFKSCNADGRNFIHWESLRLKKNRCEWYQCQNGTPVLIRKSCNRFTDGSCHLLGEHFLKDGVTYACTSRVQNGVSGYKYVKLKTKPGDNQACHFANKTYTHLQIFTLFGICGFLQCQNGQVRTLTLECILTKYGRCYNVGQQVRLDDNHAFQCSLSPDNTTARFEIVGEIDKACTFQNTSYRHLEIFKDGCHTKQCQDGSITLIQAGCLWSEKNQCKLVNSVWKHGNTTLTCLYGDGDDYRVIEVSQVC